MNPGNEWWHEFFPLAHLFFGQISSQTTREEVRYFVKKLGLKKGMSFLDCPCGTGRISLPLAARGIEVTGVDITPLYVDELENKARRKGLSIRTFRGDMRRIRFDNEFDAAGSFGASFGYFKRESDNILTLKKMYRALKPGGKFLLHLTNRDWMLAYYRPNSWDKFGEVNVLQKRHFDFETSVNRGVWIFVKDGKEEQVVANVRMYSLHELVAMFKAVGFIDVQGYGTVKDEPVSQHRRMMFVVGTKPKRGRRPGSSRVSGGSVV